MKCTVIIPSAGTGVRFGNNTPKQYLDLCGKPLIIHTLEKFQFCHQISSIIIAADPVWHGFIREKAEEYEIKKLDEIVEGGERRQDSVQNALKTNLALESDIILIHDAVRPLVSLELINKVVIATAARRAIIPVLPVKETIKEIARDGLVFKTHDRSVFRVVQTPQGFQRDLLIESYIKAAELDFISTDDASVVEFAGHDVQVIDGEEQNIKITTQFDMNLAEALLKEYK